MYIATFTNNIYVRYMLVVGMLYYFLSPPVLQRVKGTTVACSGILKKAGLTGWRMGQSRVFLRYYHEEKLQLMLKNLDDKALILQRVYRGRLARKWLAEPTVKFGTEQ